MLDDKDVFHGREATELLNDKLAPQWFSSLFLLFNLLGARGVYYNLMNFNAWSVIASLFLWSLTFGILVNHNRVFRKLDEALNS